MGSINNTKLSSLSTSDKVQTSSVQPPSPTTSRRSWDTGFPEPLSLERNTTLRFPGADTSPTACIEDTSIALTQTQSRRLRLSSRRSKSGSHGFLPAKETTSTIAMYEDGTYTESTENVGDEGMNGDVLKDGSGNVSGRPRKESTGSSDGSIGSKKNRRNLLGIFHHKN
ncbi:hypothetical protein B7463_g4004, partial [Scytalidium lignicola]